MVVMMGVTPLLVIPSRPTEPAVRSASIVTCSVPAEHLRQGGGVKAAVEPGIQLLERAFTQPFGHPLGQRAEAAGQQPGQGIQLPFELLFEPPPGPSGRSAGGGG